MKNRGQLLLLFITGLFLGFLSGFFVGRNHTQEAVLISVPPQMLSSPVMPTETEISVSFPLNLNRATKEELLALPKIGETLADRILAHRRERGRFVSIYDLYEIEGITEGVFSEIEDLIYIGG